MTIPLEAVEAATNALYGKPICFNPECEGCEYERGEALAALTAALPAIEKEIRAQVAAELYSELPVQLGKTAGSDTGWLSDLQYVSPETSADFERVELSDGGSIDLYHITEHAARIAEGKNK